MIADARQAFLEFEGLMNLGFPSRADKAALCIAYDLAIAELTKQRPFRSDIAKLKMDVMTAILELAQTGDGDSQKLANYAVKKCGRHP